MTTVKIGLAGLGTVGSGTFQILQENSNEISRRLGFDLEVVQIGARRDNPNCDTGSTEIARDIFELVGNKEIDIIVELIGGVDTARDFVLQAINNGKHVVTANKALIAEHGNEIFEAAKSNGVIVAFESSVAGGIPIIKAVREGLSANSINWIAGIINGTGNFILTAMEQEQRDFDSVLSQAQELGYAEADPTFDIDGTDAAHKLAILASLACGVPLNIDAVYKEGINSVTQNDIAFASELGYRIKHLGIFRQHENGLEVRVHPALIPLSSLLANVQGVMNAVMVDGNAVGPTLYYGAGAGAKPTGSAVVADIIDVARAIKAEQTVPMLAFENLSTDKQYLPIDETVTGYYLRIQVQEKTGVLAKIATILGDLNISIDAILQKDAHGVQGNVPVVILTKQVEEKKIINAVKSIESLPECKGPVVRLRVEHLDVEGVNL